MEGQTEGKDTKKLGQKEKKGFSKRRGRGEQDKILLVEYWGATA